jgi:16S rRNA (cytosine967-C5)-methyltransferase
MATREIVTWPRTSRPVGLISAVAPTNKSNPGASRSERRKHKPQAERQTTGREAPHQRGLGSRRLALQVIEAVMQRQQTLDEALAHALGQPEVAPLEARDRAFARLIVTTVLRRHGQLSDLIGQFLERPLPQDAHRVATLLEIGAAQLLFLDAPPHAVIDTAVTLCGNHKRTFRFRGLVNAVLRRIADRGKEIVVHQDSVTLNVPDWLLESWRREYGPTIAHEIAEASLAEATLDVSVKADESLWAVKLAGTLLPTGTIRLPQAAGRIDEMQGFEEGAWWVQDFAAALPARLFGPLEGRHIADLCAAPGGKTAQLAAAGAQVVAVDHSEKRLRRLDDNMSRVGLTARTVLADARQWRPDGPLDGILLDAPCSATGTIRRHPDILHHKTFETVRSLVALQKELLHHCVDILPPGATLVFCTCSLQPEEGPGQISALLAHASEIERNPITTTEIGGLEHLITADGDIRTLPMHTAGSDGTWPGMDGFYIARLRKRT